jgi:hypothetical protein
MPPTWINQLRNVLCSIYEAWGGNCANLGTSPPDWVKMVCYMYDSEGPPPVSGGALIAFLNLLTDLENCLAQPEDSLSLADQARLTTLIFNLRNDLGP